MTEQLRYIEAAVKDVAACADEQVNAQVALARIAFCAEYKMHMDPTEYHRVMCEVANALNIKTLR